MQESQHETPRKFLDLLVMARWRTFTRGGAQETVCVHWISHRQRSLHYTSDQSSQRVIGWL